MHGIPLFVSHEWHYQLRDSSIGKVKLYQHMSMSFSMKWCVGDKSAKFVWAEVSHEQHIHVMKTPPDYA